MAKKDTKPKGPPLRVEDDTHPWLVTNHVAWGRTLPCTLVVPELDYPAPSVRQAMIDQAKASFLHFAHRVTEANHRRGPCQCILAPDHAVRMMHGTIGSAVARAQERFDVRIFALSVAPTHFRLAIQTKHKNRALFMAAVNKNITNTVNYLTGNEGTLWRRKYTAIPLPLGGMPEPDARRAEEDPLETWIVSDPNQWTTPEYARGIHGDYAQFEWFNRTHWQRSGRPEHPLPFVEKVLLHIEPLPGLWAARSATLSKPPSNVNAKHLRLVRSQ